jgi:hypothetical protein
VHLKHAYFSIIYQQGIGQGAQWIFIFEEG